MLKRLQPSALAAVEAALIGLFFVQALRYLVGALYSRYAGASILLAVNPADLPLGTPGVIDPGTLNTEITLLVYTLALPIIAVLLGRFRAMFFPAVAITAIGRVLMLTGGQITAPMGAMITVGGGLLYLALMARHRARLFPVMLVAAVALDQVFRAAGNTLDPSRSPTYLTAQAVLSTLALLLSLTGLIWASRRPKPPVVQPDHGLLSLWGAIGLAGWLYLEIALLALPNAIAGRADADYTLFVPITLGATALALIPAVRSAAGVFIGTFAGGVRGWVWLLLLALLLIFGTRLSGLPAGIALAVAQFMTCLLPWWFVRPRTEKERSFSGLWLTFAMLVFGVLIVADVFTFEYAFVRDFTGSLAFLNGFVTPLLRGFRGLGVAVLLFALLLAALSMTQSTRRVAWANESRFQSIASLLFGVALVAIAAFFARPPVITGAADAESVRVGTYNIHAGYNELFDTDLEAIAATIATSGVNVVLLQEVEVGRMSSFGVDQALWLARRLGMDRRFYATNEGLHGLAVLSRVPIAFDEGTLLTSDGQQTGVQRVQILPRADAVLTVYNVWLSPLVETSGEGSVAAQEQDQQRQLEEVFAVLQRDHPDGVFGRTIVGGTYHNVPDSTLIGAMRGAGFEDSFSGQPIETSATFVRTGQPRARFDYLWLLNLPRLGTGVIPNAASTHRLAFAEVALDRPR